MQNKQSKLKNFFGLFLPSPISGVLSVCLAIFTIVLNQFVWIKHYLRLPSDSAIQRSIASTADHALTTVLGQSRTDVLVVGAFWALVGLGVYVLLRGLARYIAELDDDISLRRFVWPKGADRGRPLRMMIERTAFRAAALAGLILVLVGPVAKTLKGPVFVEFLGPNKILQYIVWFIVSLLLWHTVAVLLRLVALRVRIIAES